MVVFAGCRKSLKVAIESGAPLQDIQRLLGDGAAVNDTEEGGTPLYWASSAARFDVVMLLIDAGADVNARSYLGRTALHGATGSAPWHGQIAAELIKRGASVNVSDEAGVTPLHLAAVNGNPHLIRLLIERGADIEAKDHRGATALHWAVSHGRNGDAPNIRALLVAGADPFTEDIGNLSPVVIAALMGKMDIGRDILRGRNLDCLDAHGNSLLHDAVRADNRAMIILLLDCGANINSLDHRGKSPLTVATELSRNDDIVTLLRERGAIMESGPAEESVPPSEADLLAQAERVRTGGGSLSAADRSGTTLLHEAALYGYVELAEFLLSQGTTPNVQDALGLTPLHYAAMHTHIGVARLLVGHGAEVNTSARGLGFTPLHFALAGKETDLELVGLLVEAGAGVNVASDMGRSKPLHFAANRGAPAAIELLLTAGGEVNARDSKEMTPLHIATQGGHKEAVRLLLKHGAQRDARDILGRTPLDLASESGFSEIVALLKE